MTAALLIVSCLSATVFMEQPIDGLYVGQANALTGKTPVGYYQADFDGDGKTDLLLPSGFRERHADGDAFVPGVVAFQRQGAFPESARVPLPTQPAQPFIDVWGGEVYMRVGNRLKILAYTDGVWRTALDQEVAWPDDALEEEAAGEPALVPGRKANLTPFLHDLNRDGTPEVVLMNSDGVHIYRRDENGYAAGPPVSVLPPLTLMDLPHQTLWPPDKRQIAFPARQMFCRIVIDGSVLSVITPENIGEKQLRYQLDQYRLENGEQGYVVAPDGHMRQTTPTMADFMRPCRLNRDDRLDFAGADWEYAHASVLPTWVHTTVATTDGGSTFQYRRSSFFRPQVLFVDFDSDGDLDLVSENTGLYEGGIRETINRLFTSRDLTHEVCVYYQGSDGRFSEEPDVRHTFTIQLEQPPINSGPMFEWYLGMSLFDYTGDFNGDGIHDVLVHDKRDRLAVYINKDGGYSDEPDAVVSFDQGLFGVTDVDGDGRSDIVEFWGEGDRKPGADRSRVFFAREGAL